MHSMSRVRFPRGRAPRSSTRRSGVAAARSEPLDPVPLLIGIGNRAAPGALDSCESLVRTFAGGGQRAGSDQGSSPNPLPAMDEDGSVGSQVPGDARQNLPEGRRGCRNSSVRNRGSHELHAALSARRFLVLQIKLHLLGGGQRRDDAVHAGRPPSLDLVVQPVPPAGPGGDSQLAQRHPVNPAYLRLHGQRVPSGGFASTSRGSASTANPRSRRTATR